MLNPDFPVVDGRYQMTKDWSVTLPQEFNRRIEDGSLVIWRPGFTMWINVWNNDKNQPSEQRLSRIKRDISPKAFDFEEENNGDLLHLAYRLKEPSEDKRVPAFYCFSVGQEGHVQMAIYFDHEKDLIMAKEIWRSLKENEVR